MSVRRKIGWTVALVGALLLLVVAGIGLWSGAAVLKGSGECPPEVARVNALCAGLESDPTLRLACTSPTGTREWAACERRDNVRLAWAAAPDGGWQSDPSASGWVTESTEVADGGPWSCTNGRARLSLHASSIPAGEEARAAVAFGKACARLRDTAR